MAVNEDLRRQLAALGAASATSEGDELAQRLQRVAPVLAADLQGAVLQPVFRRLRNAAVHCFEVLAADIATADGSAPQSYSARKFSADGAGLYHHSSG